MLKLISANTINLSGIDISSSGMLNDSLPSTCCIDTDSFILIEIIEIACSADMEISVILIEIMDISCSTGSMNLLSSLVISIVVVIKVGSLLEGDSDIG